MSTRKTVDTTRMMRRGTPSERTNECVSAAAVSPPSGRLHGRLQARLARSATCVRMNNRNVFDRLPKALSRWIVHRCVRSRRFLSVSSQRLTRSDFVPSSSVLKGRADSLRVGKGVSDYVEDIPDSLTFVSDSTGARATCSGTASSALKVRERSVNANMGAKESACA